MELCKKTMIDSYSRISFSAEKRGEGDFIYYSELLENDLKELGENQGNYREKFIDKVMTIYNRQMRCTSAMIVGPANYNLKRHEKAWASRDNALKDFDQWRTKYFKAVNRERVLSPEEEIDKTLEELERLEFYHDFNKSMNKIKDVEAKKAFAIENDMLEVFEKWSGRYGHVIPSFHLTNINNKIKERKKKIETMKIRIERKESFEKILFKGGFVDIENDRVVIKHDEKPNKESLDLLRSSGFRYSPKTISWVRKHTGNAIADAKILVNKFNSIGI